MFNLKSIQSLSLGLAALLICGTASADFIVNEANGYAQIYGSSGGYLGAFASGLSTPIGIAQGGGNIYINELLGGAGGGGQTTKFSTAGANLGVVNSSSTYNGHNPAGLAWSDNRINSAAYGINYLTSSGPDAGTEDGNPGTPLSYLYYAPSTSTIHGLASANPNGFTGVYFSYSAGDGSGGIGYWDPGVVAVDSIYSVAAGSTPRGLVTDGSGNLFFALYGSGEIMKRDSSGTVTTWLTGLNTPTGLAIDGGNLYVSSFGNQTISGYSLANASLQSSFATQSSPQYFIVTSVPEPGTLALFAGGGVLMLALLRRRSS